MDWIDILLWPFKMAYKLLSVIVQGIILGIEKIFSKGSSKPRKSGDLQEYAKFRLLKKTKGDFDDFEGFIIKNPSTIGIILGARGTGKSAIGLKLLENIHSRSRKNFYAVGFKELPSWITVIDKFDEIKNNSFVLFDEGGILFSSRKSGSDVNKMLSELLLISRHKDLSIIFIAQNSANLDINIIRQADYLLMKPSSLLQLDFERKKIQDIYTAAEDSFKRMKGIKGLTYVYSERFTGFVANNLPTFWTAGISKSFRK